MKEDRFDPYTPPASSLAPQRREGGISVRAAMLKHEVGIHSVALACFGLGVLLVCAGIVAYRHNIVHANIVYAAVTVGCVHFILAYGLRRFSKGAQIVAVVVSSLIVFIFPLYLLVTLFIIPSLANRQARRIFTDEYRTVIASTPHLSIPVSRMPRIIILILGISFTVLALFSPAGR